MDTHRFVAELLDPARHVSVAAQLRGDVGRHGRVEKRPDQEIGHLFLLLLRVVFFWKNKREKIIITIIFSGPNSVRAVQCHPIEKPLGPRSADTKIN